MYFEYYTNMCFIYCAEICIRTEYYAKKCVFCLHIYAKNLYNLHVTQNMYFLHNTQKMEGAAGN